jgi:hypothetical protein
MAYTSGTTGEHSRGIAAQDTRDWQGGRGFEVFGASNPELRIAPVALGVPVARLRGRRDLTENLPLRLEPIVERRSIPVPSLTVELIGPFCDQDVQVIAGRQR